MSWQDIIIVRIVIIIIIMIIIVRANLRKIEAHNEREEQGLETWRMAVTQFADLTEEVQKSPKKLGKIPIIQQKIVQKAPFYEVDLSFLSQEFKQEMLGGYVRTPQSLGGHGNKNFSLVT